MPMSFDFKLILLLTIIQAGRCFKHNDRSTMSKMDCIHNLHEVMLMTITQLEIFSKVVEMGSFTKTAEALNMTQSAVSHSIGGLETELGLVLLIRDRKEGVIISEFGMRIS